jgi:hypothetical protein
MIKYKVNNLKNSNKTIKDRKYNNSKKNKNKNKIYYIEL